MYNAIKHDVTRLMDRAKKVFPNAYAPYSHFPVACAIETKDGDIFTGVNVENTSYGLSICAETGAICDMINANQRHIHYVLILTNTLCTPCGACLQRIREFGDDHTAVYCYNMDGQSKIYRLADLLPVFFTLPPQG